LISASVSFIDSQMLCELLTISEICFLHKSAREGPVYVGKPQQLTYNLRT
jgi:hypothetical protein